MSSQYICETPTSCAYSSNQIAGAFSGTAADPIFIKVYLHLVREDDGTGGITLSDIEDIYSSVNDAFDPLGIHINFCSKDINCSPCLTTGSGSEYLYLYQTNSLDDGINIYVRAHTQPSIRGSAFGIPSKNVQIEYAYGATGIIHELGHCLGLKHTFVGGCDLSNPGIREFAPQLIGGILVNSSNCHNAGDEICDTPADPYQCDPDGNFYRYENGSCVFDNPKEITDPEGNVYIDPYNNTTNNFMSYRPFCSSKFTAGQSIHMKNMISFASELVGIEQDQAMNYPPVELISTTEEVTTTITWTGTKSFLHDVRVKPNGNLVIKGTAKFAPGTGLIVEEGGQLRIQGGTLTVREDAGCFSNNTNTGMWDGILFEGQYDGIFLVTANSTIEHAVKAIGFEDITNSVNINIWKANFFNNLTSLERIGQNNTCLIHRSTFEVNNNYKGTSISPQIILEGSSPNIISRSNFNNYNTSIVSNLASAITVYNSSFFSLGKGNIYRNWEYAVSGYNNPLTKLFRINESEFLSNGYGVHTLNVSNLNINNNDFYIGDGNGSNKDFGIYSHFRILNFRIDNNDFYSSGEADHKTGIRIGDSRPKFNEKIEFSTFEGLNTGINAESSNGDGEDGLTFECNTFTNSLTQDIKGSLLIKANIGSPIKPSGNKFSRTGSSSARDFNFVGLNIGNGAVFTPLYYYNGQNPDEIPLDYIGINPMLSQIQNNTYCNEDNEVIITDPDTEHTNIKKEEKKIKKEGEVKTGGDDVVVITVITSVNPTIIPTTTTTTVVNPTGPNSTEVVTDYLVNMGPWMTENAAMALLENASNFSESQMVDIFVANSDLISAPSVYVFLFGDSSGFSQRSQDILQSARTTITERTILDARLKEVQYKKIQNIGYALDLILSNENIDYDNARRWMARYQSFYADINIAESFMDQKRYDESLHFLNNMQRNTSLSRDELTDLTDYIELNTILTSVYKTNRTERDLTTNELNKVNSIANGTSNHAKSKAQVLLNYFYNYQFTNTSQAKIEIIKIDQQLALPHRTANSSSINIFPNPNNGIFTIDLGKNYKESSLMDIYDMNGRMVKSIEISGKTKAINLEDLQKGIFFYRVSSDNNIPAIGKLIIK